MKNPTHSFRETNLLRKLKVKLRWIGARESKKRTFLYCLFYPNANFSRFVFYLNVYCTEYTFRICNHYFIHFCCLFLKSLKAFSVSLSILRFLEKSYYVIFMISGTAAFQNFIKCSYISWKKLWKMQRYSIHS